MGKIFYIMGKSSSGKDSIYQHILENKELELKKLIPYTTRPIRNGEQEGREYHFVGESDLKELTEAGKVVELRAYQTRAGVWKYFTVDDGQINLRDLNYIMIGTLESYQQMKQYFGNEILVPLYIEVEDGVRLERAIAREKKQLNPHYEELCRRFLADNQDFSEQRLQEADIKDRFINEGNLSETVEDLITYIRERLG